MNFIKSNKYCKHITHGTHDSPKYVENGFHLVTSRYIKDKRILLENSPLISREDFDKVNQRSKIEVNDILFSMIGTVGEVAMVKNDNFAIKNMGLFRCFNKKDALFLFYYFQSNLAKVFIASSITGSTQHYLTLDSLKSFPIPEISEDKKQHIVDTIGSVDSLIEKNEEIIFKTHKLIDDIYLKETSTLELVKISELDYFNISKSGINKFEKNKIYLDTSAVSDTNITDESYIIDYKNRPSRANMQPKENTIWFAKLKDSPKYILVKNQKRLLKNFVFSTGFIGLKSEKYIVNYVYALILSKSFTNQKNLLSNGSTMQGINNEIFMNILVPNANKIRSRLIGEKLENYVNLICGLQEKNYKLKQIKETLLQKYFY